MEGDSIYARKHNPHEFRFPSGKRSLLDRLDIELTERCNNSCIHCCINLPENDPARSREMDTPFIREIVTQAADLGCLMVRFTGGEPLLREDFADLYLFTRRLGMQVILFTNGRSITPEIADLFRRYPPGRPVEISVYGMHPATYDAASGMKGAFLEFRRGVELLRKNGVRVVLKSCILPHNRVDMAEFEGWLGELHFEDPRPRYAMNYDLRSRRDDPGKSARIARLRVSPEETVRVLAASPRYIPEMRDFCGKFIGPPGDRLFACGAGHGACVDAYGRAQMCLSLRDPETVVDLRETTLKSALEDTFPRFCEMKATNPEYLARCARCFLKGLCEQCPAKSWMEHGTLDTPVEYLCGVAHAQAEYVGLINAGEKGWEVGNWRERRARIIKEERTTNDGTGA
jgi:radical SAM protein with 4Fe4S-binding SPASM domain